MKKYRVWGYETVPYWIDLDAINKSDAYQKAFDIEAELWTQGETVGLWDDGGFKIKKNMIERIEDEHKSTRIKRDK